MPRHAQTATPPGAIISDQTGMGKPAERPPPLVSTDFEEARSRPLVRHQPGVKTRRHPLSGQADTLASGQRSIASKNPSIPLLRLEKHRAMGMSTPSSAIRLRSPLTLRSHALSNNTRSQ